MLFEVGKAIVRFQPRCFRRAFTAGDEAVPAAQQAIAGDEPFAGAKLAPVVSIRHVHQRKARGEEELKIPEMLKRVRTAADELEMSMDMLKRPLNVGFSGGEKKRAEILQMKLLEPKLCILDETDSGLDIDALKIVADGVNALRSPDRAVLVITHYQRLLDYIVPDTVHVLYRGQVIKSGDKDLALELEKNGYAGVIDAAA